MDEEIVDYIKSIKMEKPGCHAKGKCAHFYDTLKLGDDFINGEFCCRFSGWDEETVKDICSGKEHCLNFMDRERAEDNYRTAILRQREFPSGVLNLDIIFGGVR
jgi:hypothetical protein